MIFSFWVERRLRSRMGLLISTMIRLRDRAILRLLGIRSSFRLRSWIFLILARICFFFSSSLPSAMSSSLTSNISWMTMASTLICSSRLRTSFRTRRVLDEGLDDGLLAALDLAGDGDLALAGQQGDVAHLPEVELDRVGRPLQALEGRDELALPPLRERSRFCFWSRILIP